MAAGTTCVQALEALVAMTLGASLRSMSSGHLESRLAVVEKDLSPGRLLMASGAWVVEGSQVRQRLRVATAAGKRYSGQLTSQMASLTARLRVGPVKGEARHVVVESPLQGEIPRGGDMAGCAVLAEPPSVEILLLVAAYAGSRHA
jgi:hypothetical protein